MSQNATLSTVRLKLRPFFVEHIPVVVRFSPYLIYIYIYTNKMMKYGLCLRSFLKL